jgi:hypothetical protein
MMVSAMMRLSLVLLALGTVAIAEVVTYEATSFPEDQGWERRDVLFPADRWIEDGWFFQHAEIVDPGPPQEVEQDLYDRSLAPFAGAATFFVQWRIETDGPREGIPAVAPAALSAYGYSGILYHFTIAEDQARFIDSDLSVLLIEIEPGVPHTYYLELHGTDSYVWYIDGTRIDAAEPEGPYPTSDSVIVFGARAAVEASTTRWDYIRFGVIPQDGSGDFDSNGVDLDDLYFFQDCLLGPDGDGPGCRWADINGDGIADGQDIDLFVDALLAPPQPTRAGPGVQSVSFHASPGR